MRTVSLTPGMARSLADLSDFHDGYPLRLEREYGNDPLSLTINKGGLISWEYRIDRDGAVFIPSEDRSEWVPESSITFAAARERAKQEHERELIA